MDVDVADALALAMANPVVEILDTQPTVPEDPIPETADVGVESHKPEVSEVPKIERKDAFEEKENVSIPPAPAPLTSAESGDATEQYLREVGGLGRVVLEPMVNHRDMW